MYSNKIKKSTNEFKNKPIYSKKPIYLKINQFIQTLTDSFDHKPINL